MCREELAAPLLEALQGVAQLPVRVSELGEAPSHVENTPSRVPLASMNAAREAGGPRPGRS